MLASTVQFSNNDQSPVTHPNERFTGTGAKGNRLSPVPSDTQQRARHDPPLGSTFHAPKGQY
ncbi:hypothetical protein GCM10010246_84720 [Streptomyces cuspidosporus]|uniref:Uncharacterized protein n=1 Tax=Streptomyces cuspidosporus TaxID=66882 RepID=A0ABN3HEV2_9ACTN